MAQRRSSRSTPRQVSSPLDVQIFTLKNTIDANYQFISPAERSEISNLLERATKIANGEIREDRRLNDRVELLGCKWFDGTVLKRGYHFYGAVRGITVSHVFYGNNGMSSKESCMLKLVTEQLDSYQLERAKRRNCACKWFSAEQGTSGPAQRGYHMYYSVDFMNEGQSESREFSSKFYGNNSTPSKQACEQALYNQNFICE